MDIERIIEKHYPADDDLRRLLLTHSRAVRDLALEIGHNCGLPLDLDFVSQAAMLHDIGIYMCNAPEIHCHGTEPYIRHGIIGAELLRNEGLPRHALVCERHTGAGITAQEIEHQGLPLPHREMLPISLEEKLICYADKFYSKSGDPTRRKPLERVRSGMARFGADSLARFDALHTLFNNGEFGIR